jgi:hypothetical protein
VFDKHGLDGRRVIEAGGRLQREKLRVQLRPRNRWLVRLHDARVLGGLRVFADQKLFVPFLAVSQASD